MRFNLEIAATASCRADARFVEEVVFHREMGIRLPQLHDVHGAPMLQFIARASSGTPAGLLTVVETTGDNRILRRCGIAASAAGRSARYTRLAVMPEFRGMGLPVRLILEAHRSFVVPNSMTRSWLLFDAGRAATSLISLLLGFAPARRTVWSELGSCRALVRDEQAQGAADGIRRGYVYLAALEPGAGAHTIRDTSGIAATAWPWGMSAAGMKPPIEHQKEEIAMIRMEQIRKSYQLGRIRVDALQGVDLKIGGGEFVALAGPSGSSKTTLLNLAGCIDKPGGRIWLGEIEVTAASLADLEELPDATPSDSHAECDEVIHESAD